MTISTLSQGFKYFRPLGWMTTACLLMGLLVLPFGYSSRAAAQDEPAAPAAEEEEKEKETTEESAEEGEEDETVEKITVLTKDKVNIVCTYYKGSGSKKTVPIILLHGESGTRNDFSRLGKYLQSQGHAVIAPDLRGFGDSTEIEGIDKPIDKNLMGKLDFEKMVLDVEAVKKFFMDENNAGRVNIEMLTVLGCDMSTVVAMNWAALDWSWPQLPYRKQGQDVKALILISPVQVYKGMTAAKALTHPAMKNMSIMIIFGENEPAFKTDATKLNNLLKRGRDPLPAKPEDRKKKQDLFFFNLATLLQSIKLIESQEMKVPDRISFFIKLRLVDKEEDLKWTDRSK